MVVGRGEAIRKMMEDYHAWQKTPEGLAATRHIMKNNEVYARIAAQWDEVFGPAAAEAKRARRKKGAA